MLRSNKFLLLFLITLVVVTAAVVMTYRSSPNVKRDREDVFPGLVDRINDIAKIEVMDRDGELTVVHREDRWVIEQADNYPASFDKIKKVAVAVADLKLLSTKTSNPSLYNKLGVENPEGEQAKSRRITLRDSADKELASMIVGNRRTSSAPGNSPGYYIRLPGQEQALLVEGDLNIGVTPGDWIDAEIIDIDSKLVREVEIVHPDGSKVLLSREKGKEDFLLADIPEGKEAQSTYTLNRAGSILDNIRADDVRSAQGFDFPQEFTVATVRTYNGLTARITGVTVDDDNWARFEFDYQPPATQEEVKPVTDTAPEGNESRVKEAGAEKTVAPDAPEAESEDKKDQIDEEQVELLRQKTAGWVYKIPSYKFDLFTRKLDDLVKDIEPEEEEEQQEN